MNPYTNKNQLENEKLLPEAENILNQNYEDTGEISFSLIPAINVPVITKQYLKEVKQMLPRGNRYLFSDGISHVEIKVVSDEIIRVRLAPQGEFLEEFSYAID